MVFGYCRWTDILSHFLHHSYLKKMTLFHILISVLGTISWATEVVTTTPPVDIYWNRTNDIFLRNNNDHIVQVQIKERIRFLCPFYDEGSRAENEIEHYIIYRLPKRYYDSCYIPSNANEAQLRTQYGIEKVHNCSSPYDQSVFTSIIDTFTALPGSFGGLAYRSGQEYYFTSISTGAAGGLHNRLSAHSACKKYNMKAIVRVCCNDTFTDPPIVTGDPNPPITPTAGHSLPSTTQSSTTPQTTVTWSAVTSHINNNNSRATKTTTFDSLMVDPEVNSYHKISTSIFVMICSLILGGVVQDLT